MVMRNTSKDSSHRSKSSNTHNSSRRRRRSNEKEVVMDADVVAAKSRFFIPGINGRARCLMEDQGDEEYIYQDAKCRPDSRQSSLCSSHDNSNPASEASTLDASSSSSSRRSRTISPVTSLTTTTTTTTSTSMTSTTTTSLVSQKDDNFSNMLQELKTKRREADQARKSALKIKKRFERLVDKQRRGSAAYQSLDAEERNEHLEKFERNMASIRSQLQKFGK
uniref:Uncharacterized protein n=1 Tax=Cyclophora tenuis TaxID=216820 RepID=A0A7S1CXY9_CYCTE|mmetsp:Transcript_14191/g.24090  ORF Transcript_14191/g.24090 Transcript_14191/m.24090 type:complete len:222 (+) Transcript_14191:73-738(+)|eukprot:CAMPEP_0116558620 /NCGR_PEP_ID=MMETSP0397-20121206/9907_1 /TAXON_ID=216820 /ORGANISM="Cyclophora tenuis, Strain ECT3854" /LENGTH=221 /DNA_ID=CAMNT_0004084229 /DNA_START=62 /DNA_END=727 /DNA_ORIENTATION=+